MVERTKARWKVPIKRDALTDLDVEMLERCYISPQLAIDADLFRVDSLQGAQLVGRNGQKDYAGLVFPYYWPGEQSPREYRLRRDNPDLEQQSDGSIKEKAKYLSPPGRGNFLYFVRGTLAHLLTDTSLPIILTEGEKKTIALHRLAQYKSSRARFLPIGLPGVWNWRGKVGKTIDAKGLHRDVKGPIPDLGRVTWASRTVYIAFDSNVSGNESVEYARIGLAKELRGRGAEVRLINLPSDDGVNGIDDLLASRGPDFVLGLIEGAQPEVRSERKSQSTRLVELSDGLELFHSRDGEAFASFTINGHLETWPVRSSGFRDLLVQRFYASEAKAPSSQSLLEAANVLNARARFDGPSLDVHVRIARNDDGIYVDLADETWRVTEVTRKGWRVIAADQAPVRFRRASGMLALAEPTSGCRIDSLRQFVNVADHQWPLLLGVMVSYFRPDQPFPVLALHGEQGSAKSTTARVLRSLVDPNKAALRSEPRDERDLMIAAKNGWIVALDNLSKVSSSLSDALCRLATGGGFGTRKLYENDEEVLFDAKRPVMLNGIEELATRSDLLDRAVVLTLPAIPDNRRRTEASLWAELEKQKSGILGALLTAVSCALKNENSVSLERSPRMADFCRWAVAAEPGLGLNEGHFMRAYAGNRESSNDIALEASVAATAIIKLVDQCERWTGTSSELLGKLNQIAGDDLTKQHGWPKSAQALGGALKRLSPNLRRVGVIVEKGSGRQRRTWSIEKASV